MLDRSTTPLTGLHKVLVRFGLTLLLLLPCTLGEADPAADPTKDLMDGPMMRISDVSSLAAGALDLLKGNAESQISFRHFNYPEGAKRIIRVLLPVTQKKGSILLVNCIRLKGVVVLGSARSSVKPGERTVSKPLAEASGIFRMLADYADAEQKLVPCDDRYLPVNWDSRDFQFHQETP